MDYDFRNVWKHYSAVKEHVMYHDSLFYRGTYQELEGDEIYINHGVYKYIPSLGRKIDINICVNQNYDRKDYYTVNLDDLRNEGDYQIDIQGLAKTLCKFEPRLDCNEWGDFYSLTGFLRMTLDEAKELVKLIIDNLIKLPEEDVQKHITFKLI